MRIIPPDGQRHHPRAFLCGERPGYEEHRAGRGFVGVSGEELWTRLARFLGLEREECWVTNLVKTFAMEPPSPAEIARDAPRLREELRTIQPRLVLAIGAYAARWFVPALRDLTQDYFHGLAFTSPRCPGAIVIPIVHPAAALRQPDLYQHQFTEDVRAVGRALRRLERGRVVVPHPMIEPEPVQVGLAGLYRQPLGLDTEGFLGDPECVTVAGPCASDVDAAIVEVGVHSLGALAQTIASAPEIAIHHAKHDWQILADLGIDLPPARVDCTMLEAYELGLPQALKVLAFRLFGWRMSEYDDLITPVDDALVVHTLEAAYGQFVHARDRQVARDRAAKSVAAVKAKRARARARGRRYRETAREKAARQAHFRYRAEDARDAACQARGVAQGGAPAGDAGAPATDAGRRTSRDGRPQGTTPDGSPGAAGVIPARALTSIKGIITKAADTPRRQRWLHSKFSPHVPLPPAPTWRSLPPADRVRYALTDAVAHRKVHADLAPRIADLGLRPIYRIDRGILPFLVRNEQIGMQVDLAAVHTLRDTLRMQYGDVLAQIHQHAGRDVNPLASEDISSTIFEDWGATPTRLTRTGFHTTADKYLKARKDQHAGIPLVIEARQINKFLGTYVEKFPALLRNGRYHPDWKYTRTSSGRPSETIILLIPKHDPTAYAINPATGKREPVRLDRAKAIRNTFVAGDGHTLISCDLSQIEMRMMAHESRDPLFLDAFSKGLDFHAGTAHHLLGAPKAKADQDESAHRLPAKTLNFGVLMGMTEYGLVDQLHEHGRKEWVIDIEEEAERQLRLEWAGRMDMGWERWARLVVAAQAEIRRQGFKSTREFLVEWFKLYKGVRTWCDGKIAEAERTGYVRDFRGRRIPVDGVWSSDARIAAEFRRKAHAIPIQSGAISIAKRWIARIEKHTLRARRGGSRYCEPWVWVHDDVTIEADTRIRKAVTREMLACVPQDLCVPVTADAKTGDRWGELH